MPKVYFSYANSRMTKISFQRFRSNQKKNWKQNLSSSTD